MMVNPAKRVNWYEHTTCILCIAVFSLLFSNGCTGSKDWPPNEEICDCPPYSFVDDSFPIIQTSKLIQLKLGLYQPEDTQKRRTLNAFFWDLKRVIETPAASVSFSYQFYPDKRKFLVVASNRNWDIDWVGEYNIVTSDWIRSTWGEVEVYNEYVYSANYIGSRRMDGTTARDEISERVIYAITHLARQEKYRERMIFRGSTLATDF